MMNVFSKFKVALLGTILSFGLIASAGIKGVTEASATGETEPTTVTDVITADSLGLPSGSSYQDLSGVSVNKSSSALYSGKVARDKTDDKEEGIKMSKRKPYGLVSSVSGGILKSITVDWLKNADATLNVYTSDKSFSS